MRFENKIDVTRSLLDSLNTAFESRKMELISLSSIGLPLSSMLRVIEFLRRSNVFTYAAMNKAMGVIAGVADMCFLKPEGKTCWIEWKTETGRQSPQQVSFEKLCRSLGHEYHIVRSEAEFLNIINYGADN